MGKTLSAEQIACYERDGVLFPIPVLSAGEVARSRAAFEELEAFLGGRPRPVGLSHLFFRWAYELAAHPRIADLVEDILGPDLFVCGSLIICKYPGDPSYVAWHQDGTYSGLHATPTTSVWIALSESNAENGCMRVIPGSHRQQMLPHANRFAPENLLGHGEEILVDVDESQALDVTLQPGEISLHHNNIIHGSSPYRSGGKRIGFILRVVTPRLGRCDMPVTRLRGRMDFPHLDVLGEPPAAGVQEGLAAWQEFMRRRRGVPGALGGPS